MVYKFYVVYCYVLLSMLCIGSKREESVQDPEIQKGESQSKWFIPHALDAAYIL